MEYELHHLQIMSNDGDSWLSVCSLISTRLIDHEKFKKTGHAKKVFECYSDNRIKNEILSWMETYPSRTEKSLEESRRLRDLGNSKYSTDVIGSLQFYTESIIHAPHDSRELLLALGNRSAASFRLGNYEDCIADIQYAVENFQDDTLLRKLSIRKKEALKKLEKLGTVTLPKSGENTSVGSAKSNFSQNHLPAVSRGQSSFFPFASSLLKLEIDYRHHRRVIANEDIQVGEILVVEDPYAFVLLPDYFQSHCQFCSAELKCPLACSDCNDFLFCNQTCFKKAYDTFHKWECSGSRLVLDTGVGFLALRTLLKASQDPFSFHYEQVNDLEMHLDDVPVDDLISFTLTATLLLLYLEKHSDFFTSSSAQKSIDGIGFRLLKHMFQIVCNAFAAKKSWFEEKLDLESFQTCLATFASGLYPSAAMMNHSCDPNVITSFYQNTLVVRAGQKIKKGEEVFNCYGPHYRLQETEQRKEMLKNQFYFNCECKQCTVDETIKTNFLCLNCLSPCTRKDGSKVELKCTSCGAVLKKQQYDDLFRKAESMQTTGHQLMKQREFEKALSIFEEAYKFLQSFLDYSSPEVEECSSHVESCHLFMMSWRYVNERAKRIKFSYGEYSLQYGEFLRLSLAHYLKGIECKMPSRQNLPNADLMQYAEELEEIVLYNFGSWGAEYLYVKRLKNSLIQHQS